MRKWVANRRKTGPWDFWRSLSGVLLVECWP